LIVEVHGLSPSPVDYPQHLVLITLLDLRDVGEGFTQFDNLPLEEVIKFTQWMFAFAFTPSNLAKYLVFRVIVSVFVDQVQLPLTHYHTTEFS
jgi:hypothetical protein